MGASQSALAIHGQSKPTKIRRQPRVKAIANEQIRLVRGPGAAANRAAGASLGSAARSKGLGAWPDGSVVREQGGQLVEAVTVLRLAAGHRGKSRCAQVKPEPLVDLVKESQLMDVAGDKPLGAAPANWR